MFSVFAGGAGADRAARGSYDCDYNALAVAQQDKVVSAKGRLRCKGSGVGRQVLKVCLMQHNGVRYRDVKCQTRRKGGPGLLEFSVSRNCAKISVRNRFLSRINVRTKLTNGDVKTRNDFSDPSRYRRNCI